MQTIVRHRLRRAAVVLLVCVTTVACDPLRVDDPTLILESDLDNAEGADLLRRDVLRALYEVTDDAGWESGLFADEFLFQRSATDQPATRTEELVDLRAGETLAESNQSAQYGEWQALWGIRAAAALVKLEEFGPRAHVGEVLAVRALAALRLAEHYCSGFPLHDVVDFKLARGSSLSTAQVLDRALSVFDSALSFAGDSAHVLNFVRVGRARTLLQLGRFSEAAAAASGVPTSYVYTTQYSSTISPSNFALRGDSPAWRTSRSVADREGGTGLDYVSSNDPRVGAVRRGTARNGTTGIYSIGKYPDRTSPIIIASGVEARLIEAEAALNLGDVRWLDILNDLRATQSSPPLAVLVDPGTETSRVDLVFRERAFWLFATGSRLGDLRRLVRLYQRSEDAVFPSGTYWLGGTYGTSTSLPFDRSEAQFASSATGCLSN